MGLLFIAHILIMLTIVGLLYFKSDESDKIESQRLEAIPIEEDGQDSK